MEEIRVLSNLEIHNKKVINIFLVGQNELKNILLQERNRAFRQRISVNYHIEPLTRQETASYIEHRLIVAGATDTIFTRDAVRMIHAFSKGFPRLINVICDHAMLSGYSGGFKLIGADTIKECVDDLTISTHVIPPPPEPSAKIQSHDPASQVETPVIVKSLETSNVNPFYRFAYIGAFLVILFALPLLFFNNSVYQTFFGNDGQRPEIALSNKVIKIERDMPDDIAPDDKGSDIAQPDQPPAANLPEAQGSEGNDAARPRPVDEPTDIVTAEISSPAGTGKQSIEKKLEEKKFLVYFRSESTEPDSSLYETLSNIMDLLPLYPDVKIFIEGYTDSYGNYSYNKRISQLRANIVKSYFAAQGVDESQITAIGMGPENPVADNSTREGRSKNRRVEIRLED
jgi:general secretion pathway protein A